MTALQTGPQIKLHLRLGLLRLNLPSYGLDKYDLHQKWLAEQRQLCASLSTRRQTMRSDEQPMDDVKVVHAQEVQVHVVHDPTIEIDAIHVIDEMV